ncbi:glycoside hydrolase, partial [Aureobasidium melanogenum]|uniref:PA14 domain-containing protein n=1 Tax=Aureobasidium melanogenum (strain CBS 110374) TaxID=1043003 RepID=A0A074VXF3_AURM1
MRAVIALAACIAFANAQTFDMDMILAAEPVPTPAIPVVYVTGDNPTTTASATTVSYLENQAVASVSSEIVAAASSTALDKRAASTCVPQPTGISYNSSPDTASAFLADGYYSSVASAAPTPAGYINTFTNLQASNNAYGYMGYQLLKTYDTQLCSQKCDKINGCLSFNIYYERDPSVDPNDASCESPSSVVQIKCVFWGSPVLKSNALNAGQWRSKFQVVIAGSNGYVNKTISPAAGYDEPVDLGDATINAPLDCSGHDTFMQSKFFTSGPFDANLCASACSAQSVYNLAHSPADGQPKTCQFFTTFLLYRNGVALGQTCSLYTMAWNTTYNTNKGYYYGNDHYTVGYSYAFSNSTSQGAAYAACGSSSSSLVASSTTMPASSTTMTTSTATPTSPLPDTSCSNAGLQFAYYPGLASTQWDYHSANYGLDAENYKTVTPNYTGVTNAIGGFAWNTYHQSSTIYGSSRPFDHEKMVLNHRGYFFAPTSGDYTFSIPTVDDAAFFWLGDVAYSGFNEFNYLLLDNQADGTQNATVTLTAGSYYPIRLIYGNVGGGPGSLYFQITQGSKVAVDWSSTVSPYFVQYSCDGTTAPAYPAFGQEI